MRYAISYRVDNTDWTAHHIDSEMLELELWRIQDCENGIVISVRREAV